MPGPGGAPHTPALCTHRHQSAKLHFVTESATATGTTTAPAPDLRAARRQQTVQRITTVARRLTVEHGLDGFTMDDLARETGVSRRTLFNHVAGKDDAVIGPFPEPTPELFETFVAGGPHGSLLDDLAALVVEILQQNPETPEQVALGRQALHTHPRLLAQVLERMQELVESCQGFVQQREGAAYDRARFDVAVAVVVACLHLAMDRFLTGEHGTDLSPLLLDTLATAHDLLR